MGYMLEDRYLRRAFLEAMKAEPRITQLRDTVTAQQVDAHGATVTLASGKTLSARLLVGSDGRASGTAQRAGIRRNRLGLWANRPRRRHRTRTAP